MAIIFLMIFTGLLEIGIIIRLLKSNTKNTCATLNILFKNSLYLVLIPLSVIRDGYYNNLLYKIC